MPTLLLADDNVTTQRVIALTFGDQAFQVVTVGSSQQARDLMAGMRPDIVLASTSLPRNSGYELSEYMLGVETLKDVPVLLLSGAFESVDEARLKSSGARGVIEKPLEPTAVMNRVRELLGFKDAQPAQAAGRLFTTAATTSDKKAAQDAVEPPPADRKAPSEAPPHDPLAAAIARAAQGNTPGQAREDYRDTLETAFDSLNHHLELPSAGPVPNAPAPVAPVASSSVADDFAALLAIETGDAPPPPAAARSFVVHSAAPEITDAMLDQIAQRVADRLSSGTFGAELREAMAATLRDSVRMVVSGAAERLVREEIARVKARIERDTP